MLDQCDFRVRAILIDRLNGVNVLSLFSGVDETHIVSIVNPLPNLDGLSYVCESDLFV